ncbi:MAG: VCBS repeat-containing protein [Ignavibacteria bacterium]|nr:VCBS repeat-containing protein [Ignavibacteria bacterium]
MSSVPGWTRDFNISFSIVASGAGDINGDGFDDIFFSSPRRGPHGEGDSVFTLWFRIWLEINQGWSYLKIWIGRGISSAGDVNGDGYDDIIISAYWDPLLMGYADKSILFLGSAEGFSQSPDWSKSNCYGESGSGGGDINGDGYDDLIIGDGRCSPGNVYIHFGSVIGISNDPGWTIYGSDPAARFGSSVSNAGDINADGFSDIIIGAPNDNDTGKVYIYFGSASGPSDSTRLVFSCDQPLAKFGISVSSAGDVNNDGSSDVIFSAPGYSNGESGEGKVFVHYGNADLTPPLITNLSPHQNAVSVNKSSDINIVFNQNMNASTLNSSNIIVNGMYSGVIPASITYDAMLRTLTIDPAIDFKTGEKVFVLLKSGIMSENNASLTPFNFSFITSATGGSGMFQISDTIGSAENVESGDIDSDGDIDIITGQQDIKIYKNNGAGHFSYFSQIPGGTASFILKDFDLNGSLDIAYGAEGYLIKVFLNDGTGIFHQSSVSSGYIGKAGDFDGDGDPDMALLSGFDMIIVRNDNGYFTMTDTIPVIHICQEEGYPQAEYDIADMDNDGDLDIVEVHHTSLELLEMFFGCGYVELFRNDGAGNFSKETISSGRIGGNHNILEQCNITLFNYDGDDDADILLYYSKLTNTVNSQFVTSGSVWFLGKPYPADFNGDGSLDFVTSMEGELYINDGLGSFIRGENFSSWYIPKISPADFDNDGDADLAVIKDNTLILYKNIDSVTTECITGPINTEVNTTNLYFTESMLNVSFGLINFDSTEASIVSNINNDSVYINSGSIRGQFRINLSANGGIICSKIVFVDYPLPVKLAEFTSVINGRNVTLNWTTAEELNNSGFDIEKSIVKGQTSEGWSKIGFISGSGTISEPANYTFTDKDLLTGKYNYRLKQIDFNGNFEYFELAEEVSIGIPDKYELSQNYPNPFNPVTNLEYGIAKLGFVSLKIYDVLGKEVITLVNEIKEPGYYKIKFDAGKLSSGVYFYRMTAGNFVAVKKFVVMK